MPPIFLFAIPLLTWFQQPLIGPLESVRFNHFTRKDGLSQATVRSIVQDWRGFVWVGTHDGLNRFDGYEWLIYRHEPNNPQSLSGNFVTDLCMDGLGRLWVATQRDGINLYDAKTDSFQQVSLPSVIVKEGALPLEYLAIASTSNGKLWVGTSQGLALLDPEQETMTLISGTEGKVITSICVGRNDQPWFADNATALMRLRPDSLEVLDETNRIQALVPKQEVKVLCLAEAGENLLVGTSRGLFRLTPDNRIHWLLTPDHLPGNINSLAETGDGSIWVGTEEGLVWRSPDGALTRVFSHHKANPNGLGFNWITDLYQSRTGLIWIGGFGGVDTYNPQSAHFHHHRGADDHHKGLSGGRVFSLLEDSRGQLWVGTFRNGLNRLRAGTDQITTFGGDLDPRADFPVKGVYALAEKPEGLLWIGSFQNGAFTHELGSNQFQHIPIRDIPSQHCRILSFLVEDSGEVWAGSSLGILHKRAEEETFATRRLGPGPVRTAWSIHRGKDGSLWMGTESHGLINYHPQTKALQQFQQQDGLSNNRVYHVLINEDGRFWVATYRGLNLFDPHTNRFLPFPGKQEMADFLIYAVLKDENRQLWMSTNSGLIRFDPDTGTKRVFTPVEGIQEYEFNSKAYCQGLNGTLYFGGMNGFNMFNPNQITATHSPFPVAITQLLIKNKPSGYPPRQPNDPLRGPIFDARELRLDYKQNHFSLVFSAFPFQNVSNVNYQYALEGFDKDWIPSNPEYRTATYTNLSPGQYHFRVRASSDGSSWQELSSPLKVAILPAPWQTWWAYTLYAAGFFALLVLFFYLLNRNLRLKFLESERARKVDELQLQLVLAKLTTLKAKLEPHFVFNTLNSIKNTVRKGEQTTAERMITDLSTLLRTMLDRSSEPMATLSEEIDFLKRYLDLQQHRFRDRLTTSIQVKSQLNAALIPRFLLQPIVENAVKYGMSNSIGPLHLTISAARHESRLVVLVADNGSGFAPDFSFGHGLEHIHERLAIHYGKNASITLENQQGGGAQALLNLPYKEGTHEN